MNRLFVVYIVAAADCAARAMIFSHRRYFSNLGAGLRAGELLARKVGDLAMNDRSGKVTVRMGKHDNYREIPLTVPVRQVVTAYLDTRPQRKSTDPLWVGPRGAIQDRSAVLKILEKYTFVAQFPAIGPHVLMHTFAMRYLKTNSDDLRGLAALLGPAGLNTVMIYTEPTPDDLAGRMEKVESGEKVGTALSSAAERLLRSDYGSSTIVLLFRFAV